MEAKIIEGVTASPGSHHSSPHIHFPIEMIHDIPTEKVAIILPPLISRISTVTPNNPIYLGQLTLLTVGPLRRLRRADAGKFDLILEVNDEKIEKIEDARKNADVCFQISMEGLEFTYDYINNTNYVISPWRAGEVKGMEDRYGYIRILASEWISFLGTWGYGKYLTFNIPIEFEITDLKMQDLAGRLREASKGVEKLKGHRKKGEWRTIVKECRHILDLLGKPEATKIAIKKVIKDSDLPDNHAKAVTDMIKDLSLFVNPTLHTVEGEPPKIEPPYDKEDALFVEGTISLLLNMLVGKLVKG